VTQAPPPKTLGLVTGLGVGAGIFYYRSLVETLTARGISPHLVMVHADVGLVLGLAERGDKRKLAEYLAGLLKQLAAAGADVATIPAFAPQVCAEELEAIAPLPMISLLDAIAAECERRALHRTAIFGARVTMQTGLFGRLQGITEVVPLPPSTIDLVADTYRKIVETETASPEERDVLSSLARRLIDHEGVDEILLAGTDLAFVFGPEDTDFPHLDGARTHLKAIVRAVTGSDEEA
jgi:aspartate racemase